MTTNFAVPAGETRTFAGDVTVRASESIAIDGTLQVQPGAEVTLLSDGPLSVTGKIRQDGAAARQAAGDPFVVPPPMVLAGGAVDIEPLEGETNADIPAVRTGASTDLLIVVGEAGGTVRVTRSLLAGSAPETTVAGQVGGPGGSIEIGTERAVQVARERGSAQATAPARIVLDALNPPGATSQRRLDLGAGDGGDGFTTTQTTGEDGTALLAEATDAGPGGSVRLRAQEIDASVSLVRLLSGNGGDGGGVGSDDVPVIAPSGSQPGQLGRPLRFVTGNGGDGGTVDLDGTVVNSDALSASLGNGGNAGSGVVAAGSGGAGADGGALTGRIGQAGLSGRLSGSEGAGFGIVPGRAGFVALIDITNSGNGGDSASTDQPGGNGGSIELLGRAPNTEARFRLRNSSNGGAGFDGCGAAQPGAGTNGGGVNVAPNRTVAFFHDPAIRLLDAENSFLASLNGGDGGDGNPPGSGGAAGSDSGAGDARLSGSAGNTGSPCGDPGDPGDPGDGVAFDGDARIIGNSNVTLYDLNEMGDATGFVFDGERPQFAFAPAGGGVQAIGELQGGGQFDGSSLVLRLNNDRELFGVMPPAGAGDPFPFRAPAGASALLPETVSVLPSSDFPQVSDGNDAGVLVGQLNGVGINQAVAWVGSQLVTVPAPAGSGAATFSGLSAISDTNLAVGNWSAGSGGDPILYNVDANSTSALPLPAGLSDGALRGVSPNGRFAVGAGSGRALAYDLNELSALPSVLQPNDPRLAPLGGPFDFVLAEAVNDQGLVLLNGFRNDPNGAVPTAILSNTAFTEFAGMLELLGGLVPPGMSADEVNSLRGQRLTNSRRILLEGNFGVPRGTRSFAVVIEPR